MQVGLRFRGLPARGQSPQDPEEPRNSPEMDRRHPEGQLDAEGVRSYLFTGKHMQTCKQISDFIHCVLGKNSARSRTNEPPVYAFS
jgi:hypothetical protein